MLNTKSQGTGEKPDMTMLDMAELFMKVSGDLNALKNHLQGLRVSEWSYLED